jgi:hypothetical protein
MLIPSSPQLLPGPRENIILGVSGLLATVFGFLSRRLRAPITETAKAYLVLEKPATACRLDAHSTKS